MRAIMLATAAVIAAAPAAAQQAPAGAAPASASAPREGATVLGDVYRCRDIADPAARLACFDASVTALQTADRNRDIRVIDRETVNRTRRELFGLSLGRGIIGSDDEASDGGRTVTTDRVEEINATLRSVERDSFGKLVLDLDNGQRWVQVDTVGGRSPRSGEPVRVRRGALGSFIATVGTRPGIRVRRAQ